MNATYASMTTEQLYSESMRVRNEEGNIDLAIELMTLAMARSDADRMLRNRYTTTPRSK